MFDDFFHQIETELGPLCPDWFEELTVRAAKADGGQDSSLCEDENVFRVPKKTPSLDTQMYSTPKIFRNRGPPSPDSIARGSPEPANLSLHQGSQSTSSALPWRDSSPCLFSSTKDRRFEKDCGSRKAEDCFDLLDTPKSSLAQDASVKRISESLGAQLNPDLSWSSSLNTPSALSPTVILPKRTEQSPPVSFLRDKEVIFVRKLFPSLSKATASASDASLDRKEESTEKKTDAPSVSMNSFWRQTVPDAIKDGDVRNVVEEVLDGAEDILSIFFSNSSSALRRVKTNERVKKRVGNVKSTDLTSTLDADSSQINADSAADFESLSDTKDFTQWTPLNLSEVPESKARQEDKDAILGTKHQEEVTQLSQASSCTVEKEKCCLDMHPERSQGRSSLFEASPALTFTKKARKFVYRVQTPCSSKEKEKNSTPVCSSPTAAAAVTNVQETSFIEPKLEAGLSSADSGDRLVLAKEASVKPLNPEALGLEHGLDMTQLCSVFAEDFTQDVQSYTSPNKSNENNHSVPLLSTSCHDQTIKISEVQSKAEYEKENKDGVDHQEICSSPKEPSGCGKNLNLDRTKTETTTEEGAKYDSGCPVISDMNIVPSSCEANLNLYSGFKTASNKVIVVPPEAIMKAKSALDELVEHVSEPSSLAVTEATKASHKTVLPSKRPMELKPGSEAADPTPNVKSEGVAGNISDFLTQTNESGFKTASNRSILLSSFNVEKGKYFFKDLDEGETYPCLNPLDLEVQSAKDRKFHSKSSEEPAQKLNSTIDRNSSLTASQKADVTELCSILEEADSQYEFTQVRPAKLSSKSLDNAQLEKEWDPDMLAGIDFDDSFNADVGRQVSRNPETKPDVPTLVTKGSPNKYEFAQPKVISSIPKAATMVNTSLTEDLALRSEETLKPTTLKVEKNIKEEKTFCFGFKTAKGNALSVSEKCLNKAKSLFADLEDGEGNLDLHKVDSVKQDHENVPSSSSVFSGCHSNRTDDENGRCNLNKLCSPKANLEQKSEAALGHGDADLATKENGMCKPTCDATNVEIGLGSADQKENLFQFNTVNFGFCTAGGKKVNISEKALLKARKLLNEVEDFDGVSSKSEGFASPKAASDMQVISKSLITNERNTEVVDQKVSLIPVDSIGFKMASRKGVSVSASPILKSKTILKDLDDRADVSSEATFKTDEEKLDLGAAKNPCKFVNGFKMASGKGVSFSEKAFRKAKAFFEDCNPDASAVPPGNDGKLNMMDDCMTVVESVVHLPETDSMNKETNEESTALDEGVQMECTKMSSKMPLSTSGGGFKMASGKMVSVSGEALQRAKAVLDDASPCKRKIDVSEQSILKKEATVPGRDWSFSIASGKKVAVSEEALQKAKGLFTGCDREGLAPDGSLFSAAKTSATLGFSTASGKDVVVSDKALKEAKGVFAGCDESSVDGDEILSHFAIQKIPNKPTFLSGTCDVGKSEIIGRCEFTEDGNHKVDLLKAGNLGFSTASGKGVSVSKSALSVALEMFKDCDAQPFTHSQNENTKNSQSHSSKMNEKCLPVLPKSDVTTQVKTPAQSSPARPSKEDPLVLKSHSLNLNGFTVTQQKYFEQEAMACAKALLEDDLNEQSLMATSENAGVEGSFPEHQQPIKAEVGGAKRLLDEGDLAGLPPLKRRLVSEFNQILDNTRSAAVKSSPNGILKDRRVFQYNLKPIVTHPPRHLMDQRPTVTDLQLDPSHSSVQKGQPSNCKAVAFVPPFHKNIRPEKPKDGSLGAAKVSSSFVPPFIKKRSMTAGDQVEGSSKNSDLKCTSVSGSGSKEETNPPEVKLLIIHEVQKSVTEVESDVLEDRNPGSENEKEKTWIQALELARDMQDMRIRKKKRQTIRPLPGSLYLAKTAGVTRISLREAAGYKQPVSHTEKELYQRGVHCKVSQISSGNAESFRFNCEEFFKQEVFMETGGVQLADGGWLIPDNRGTVGKEEIYRALCDTPGVDPKLINESWVHNHYRWIVWKRAAMERAFPEKLGSRCLTPEQVLLQLKLRYDIEVDHSKRSALKMITERDDTPAKTLVLCVAGVFRSGQRHTKSEMADAKAEPLAAVVWLTDGWYCIKALLDSPLTAMLQRGRLGAGAKIITHGAELIGSQDACPPLEAPDSLMLKISANSTRRVRWDTKLGFYKDPRPFLLPLSSFYPTGGAVGCVDIIVMRCYPTQWMEKRSGGVFIFRNERAEEREARCHSSSKQKSVELLISKIQAQLEKEEEEKKKSRRSRALSRRDLESLQDGEELYEAMESDPTYVEAHLTPRQVEAVNSYRRGVAERRRAELQDRVHKAMQEARETEGCCPDRDVTPVWKLSITDINLLHQDCVYTLNIWRPSMELQSLLREGCRYKVYHLATSETRKRSGNSNIQFTATKKTQFQHIEVSPEWSKSHFPARQSASFRDLQIPDFSSPCGEVDVVGYVISVLNRNAPSPVLYLVDEALDLISVRVSNSLAQLALEDVVKPLALLCVSNLQLRRLSGPLPVLHAGEQALFSVKPKDAHLHDTMERLKAYAQGCETFFSDAEEKLNNLVPPNTFPSPRTPGLPSIKPNSRMNVTPQQSSRVFSPFTPVSKKTPGPTATIASAPETKDTRSVKRKRGVEYLSRIPSPPPLPPLGPLASPAVNKTFNPPRRSETPRAPPRRPGDPAPRSRRANARPQHQDHQRQEEVNDEELAMINTQALLRPPDPV